jgi:hypothetical protein
MPTTNTVLTLPGRVDSALLAKHQRAGEPLIVIKLVGVGNTAPYDFRDKGTRSYIFRFDSQMEGHLLRIPLHLWQENKARLAHDIMDQRHLTHSMIVMLEQSPAPKPATSQSHPETGATDTSTNALNVVGPGQEPTVAPTSAGTAEQQPGADAADAATAATYPLLPDGRSVHAAAHALAEPPKRLKALAALLGAPEEQLRTAISHPDSQVLLASSGWVRRRAS